MSTKVSGDSVAKVDGDDLNYLFVGSRVRPSFDPEDADTLRNMVHMDHLVGTLLKEKYGNSGRTEPYLAKRWETSPDGLVWTFYLQPDLNCEDGSRIDAFAFVQSFQRILRLYSKRQDLAAFNRIKGWAEFIAGSPVLSGIVAKSDSVLEFEFSHRPDGFPEFLSMAFYGFYCSANFENGKWKDRNHIISSGSYRLEPGSISEEGLILHKRSEFSLTDSTSPNRVRIRIVSDNEAESAPPRRTILYYHQFAKKRDSNGFREMSGAPIFLSSVVLTPHHGLWFNQYENRKIFRRKLHEIVGRNASRFAKVYPASRFYFTPDDARRGPTFSGSGTLQAVISGPHPKPKHPLKILRFSYSAANPVRQYVETMTKTVLDELGWPYEIQDPNFEDPEFIKRRNSNTEYDIRFASVDIGGSAENWVINMMFCTKLGISFPDPTGAICKLVNDHEGKIGQYDETAYLEQFEKIIEGDAAVVPLFHSSTPTNKFFRMFRQQQPECNLDFFELCFS